MKTLIIDKISPVVEIKLKEQGCFSITTEILPDKARLKDMLPDYELLIMRVDPKIDKEILDVAAGHIKLIAICATGTNHIDLDYAKKVGIEVRNSPGINSNAVVELTISKMLDLSRMVMTANKEVQTKGIWNQYKYAGYELNGHKLGIVGLGRIGKGVARLAQAFGMTTIAYDPYILEEDFVKANVEQITTIDELCRRSDYVTVHTPLTAETKGMIGANQFDVMKSKVILINCARGGIIDETAALEALKTKKIAGLGLDVMADELVGKAPTQKGKFSSLLFGQDNFIVTPHIAGSTYEGLDAIGSYIADKIIEFFEVNKNL